MACFVSRFVVLNDLERWVDTVHTCFANSSSGRGHVQIRHLPTFFPGTDAFDRCTLVSEVCSSERLSFLLTFVEIHRREGRMIPSCQGTFISLVSPVS